MIACVDLFCGIGGLTHGLIRGGIHVLAGIDLDPHCRYPYETNNNGVQFIEKDVRLVSGKDLRRIWGNARFTLLAGCAPCQPFSTYSRGGRDSRKDSKWNLLEEFARIITEAKPDFVTMENVPQLVHHPVFTRFLQSLENYRLWWKPVECADYGVPQTRKRLVLLASKRGAIKLPASSPSETGPVTVRKAIAHLRSLRAGESDPQDRLHAACSLSALNLCRIRASSPGGTWRNWEPALVAACHRKDSGNTFPSVYGRMEWDTLAPTITTQCFGYGNGRFGHPEQDRAITLREAALLQTFPPSYQFLRPGERVRFNILGRLIGNAVPVRIGEVVGIAFSKQFHN
jgi:DNA (cytosine-5)-methyltransferase 1